MATTSSTGCETLTFSFLCGLRGYNEYCYMCSSELNKVLPAKQVKIILMNSTSLLLLSSDLDLLGNNLSVICLEKFLGSHTMKYYNC